MAASALAGARPPARRSATDDRQERGRGSRGTRSSAGRASWPSDERVQLRPGGDPGEQRHRLAPSVISRVSPCRPPANPAAEATRPAACILAAGSGRGSRTRGDGARRPGSGHARPWPTGVTRRTPRRPHHPRAAQPGSEGREPVQAHHRAATEPSPPPAECGDGAPPSHGVPTGVRAARQRGRS